MLNLLNLASFESGIGLEGKIVIPAGWKGDK